MGLLLVSVHLLGVVIFVVSGQESDKVPKIPKCCPIGQSIEPLIGCKPKNLSFIPEFSDGEPKEIDIIIGDRCKYGKYRLEPSEDSADEFRLLANGHLFLPFHDENEISPNDFCLESFLQPDGTVKVLPLLCFPPNLPQDNWNNLGIKLYRIGCLISIPFLIITIAIFLLTEEWNTIRGKILVSYSSCLAIAYGCLSYVQFEGDKLAYNACISVAYMIQFFFVASFFWLNVMCFHTWRRMRRNNDIRQKNYVWYKIYGWGFPFFILLISLIMDLTPAIPSSYIVKPNVGLEACWFQNDTAKFSYFYGPISILLLANIVFFVLTIAYMHENYKKKPMNSLKDVATQVIYNKRKQIFIECLLLFCAMGLNWILEIVSWIVTRKMYPNDIPPSWIIIDTFNTLHGIIVFYIFVVRDQRVRKLALETLRCRSQYHVEEGHVPLNQVNKSGQVFNC